MKRKLGEDSYYSVKKPKLSSRSKSAKRLLRSCDSPPRPPIETTDRETLFLKAIDSLSLKTNPSLLVGREAEQEELARFLRVALGTKKTGASLCIH